MMTKEKLLKEKENILKNIEKRKGRIAQIERELKEFSYEFSDEEWKNKNLDKVFIFYDYEYSKISISCGRFWSYVPIYFKTEEDAQKAIAKIGEERLKKYYFKVGNHE